MDLSLIEQLAQYGIFAGLFVALFVWTLKSGEKRENELRQTLDKFADVVGEKLTDVCKDVEEIKSDIEDIKEKIQ